MKKVTTIKYIKEVLKNYDGFYFKDDGFHVVAVDNNDWWFETRKELFAWATFYFWNREMVPMGQLDY